MHGLAGPVEQVLERQRLFKERPKRRSGEQPLHRRPAAVVLEQSGQQLYQHRRHMRTQSLGVGDQPVGRQSVEERCIGRRRKRQMRRVPVHRREVQVRRNGGAEVLDQLAGQRAEACFCRLENCCCTGDVESGSLLGESTRAAAATLRARRARAAAAVSGDLRRTTAAIGVTTAAIGADLLRRIAPLPLRSRLGRRSARRVTAAAVAVVVAALRRFGTRRLRPQLHNRSVHALNGGMRGGGSDLRGMLVLLRQPRHRRRVCQQALVPQRSRSLERVCGGSLRPSRCALGRFHTLGRIHAEPPHPFAAEGQAVQVPRVGSSPCHNFGRAS